MPNNTEPEHEDSDFADEIDEHFSYLETRSLKHKYDLHETYTRVKSWGNSLLAFSELNK